MSDVQDWTGVSAGSTQLVASGVAQLTFDGIRFNNTFAVAGIPQTTRSLLVLGYVTATQGGGAGTFNMEVSGNVTQLRWFSQNQVLNDSGSANIGPNQAIAPQYVPFYGQVDTQATISIGATITATIDYWVLALPDADILGSAFNPMVVGNSWVQATTTETGQALAVVPTENQAGSLSVLPVIVQDSTGAQQGTEAAPLRVVTRPQLGSMHNGLLALSATGSHSLFGPPAAGFRRVLDYLFTSGTSPQIAAGVDDGTHRLSIQASTMIVDPGWFILSTDTGFFYINAATGGNVSYLWHDEMI